MYRIILPFLVILSFAFKAYSQNNLTVQVFADVITTLTATETLQLNFSKLPLKAQGRQEVVSELISYLQASDGIDLLAIRQHLSIGEQNLV